MPRDVCVMQATELMEKYLQVVKTAPAPEALEAAGEVIVVLHTTRWARILLVWRADTPKQVVIEVEVSLPRAVKQVRASELLACGEQETEMGELLKELIEHQQYLLRLKTVGFVLDVIRQDCLWTASGTFTGNPSLEVFELLIPP